MKMTNILKTQVHVVVISLLIQIAFSQVKTDFDVNWSTIKTMVRITNRLGDGSTLNLHCKSSDDDLGLKILAPNSSWSFKFRPTIIVGSTIFSCHFTWPGQSKRFNIYDDDRDGVRRGIPCIYCIWDITKDGPCRFNESDHAFDICYDWNGNPR
ncbi:Plant self-incompatibility S1 [Arabidopsis thaliana x Arabidopsis arenosa]|nr:Plant self-incompatibility S1 [Arabidopsis thaliana x Arabidopsis arenosa]